MTWRSGVGNQMALRGRAVEAVYGGLLQGGPGLAPGTVCIAGALAKLQREACLGVSLSTLTLTSLIYLPLRASSPAPSSLVLGTWRTPEQGTKL